jgi:1-acyl-sn-glycerol-3-phosphate acyltransferase
MDYQPIFRTYFLYKLIFKYIRFLYKYVLNRSYTICNPENIPTGKPFIMVANHQHGVLDALALLFMIPDGRYPVFIARADVFKNRIFAKLLLFFRLLPAFRMQDVGKNRVLENEKVFDITAQLLAKHNGILALFPEGGHQEKERLGRLKKGFTRIAFQTAAYANFEKEVFVLPVGIHHVGEMFDSRVSVSVGNPISVLALYTNHEIQPDKLQQQLLEYTKESLSQNMLTIEEDSYYNEYLVLCKIARLYRRNSNEMQQRYSSDLAIEKDVLERLDSIKNNNASEFQALMKIAKSLDEFVSSLKLSYDLLFEKKKVTQRILQFCGFFILFPFRLYSFVHQIIPFWLIKLVTKNVEDELLRVSVQLGLGALLIFPVWNILLFIGVAFSGMSTFWIFCYFLSLPLSVWLFFRSLFTWNYVKAMFRFYKLKQRQCPAIKVMDAFYASIIAKLAF